MRPCDGSPATSRRPDRGRTDARGDRPERRPRSPSERRAGRTSDDTEIRESCEGRAESRRNRVLDASGGRETRSRTSGDVRIAFLDALGSPLLDASRGRLLRRSCAQDAQETRNRTGIGSRTHPGGSRRATDVRTDGRIGHPDRSGGDTNRTRDHGPGGVSSSFRSPSFCSSSNTRRAISLGRFDSPD